MSFQVAIKMAAGALSAGKDYASEFLARLGDGTLDRRFMWYGWEGAGEYAFAVAQGDVAGEADIDHRRGKCSVCPSRVPDAAHPKRLGHCGPKFDPVGLLRVPRTCGCPCEMIACVASKACPQDQFPAVLTFDGRDLVKKTCKARP